MVKGFDNRPRSSRDIGKFVFVCGEELTLADPTVWEKWASEEFQVPVALTKGELTHVSFSSLCAEARFVGLPGRDNALLWAI